MNLWSRLRERFWFLPALLCVAAVVLAETLIYVDGQIQDSDLGSLSFLINRVGESGSRDLLGAIAGSMLTVASTTFSITIAVLAVSSSTYGPRLVRNFMADRSNQLVLGVFVATFLYALLVLRSIRVIGSADGEYFVPHLAVNVAVLLAVVSIGVLVFFIHHISDSVQIWTLAEQVRSDLMGVVDRMYPEDAGRGPSDVDSDGRTEVAERSDGADVTAARAGYVQGVDLDGLLELAGEHEAVVGLEVRPGQHVVEGSLLATVWPGTDPPQQLRDGVRSSVQVGRARTPHQDVESPALLLEEMAVRALSPSTNDPYTAINALDALASGLVAFAGRAQPSAYRYDGHGTLRVVAPHVSLLDVVDHLLDAMRFYALEHPTVLHRALELLQDTGRASHDPDVRRRIGAHADRLVEAFTATSPHSHDLEALSSRAAEVRRSLFAGEDTR